MSTKNWIMGISFLYSKPLAVVHRVRWWRLRSASHLWTRRWLCSPSLEAHCLEQWEHWKSVVVITAEAALRCLSLWQQWVSGIEPLRSWQQLCEPSLAILVCPWYIPPSFSVWCGTSGEWLWPCLYTAVLVNLCFFCRNHYICANNSNIQLCVNKTA